MCIPSSGAAHGAHGPHGAGLKMASWSKLFPYVSMPSGWIPMSDAPGLRLRWLLYRLAHAAFEDVWTIPETLRLAASGPFMDLGLGCKR